MKRLGSFLADAWQPFIYAVVAIGVCITMYTFRSGTLVSGFSTSEARSVLSATSGKRLLENPVSLPYKLGQYTLFKLDRAGARPMRALSSVFAIASIVLFYYVIRRWHTTRVALLTTAIFASSSWMLHVGRTATPDVLLVFFPLLLVASGIYIRRSKHDIVALHFGAIIAAFCMYIPFAPVFIFAAMIWRAPSFLKGKNKPAWWLQITSTILFLLLVGPLVYAVANDPSLLRQLFLVPENVPSLTQVWHNLVGVGLSIPFKTFGLTPDQWLGQLSVLDMASFVLLILGLYGYLRVVSLQRTRILLLTLVVSLTAIALSNNPVNISLIIPTIYVLVSGGITHLLQEWFTVFPRNPIARSVGTSCVTILVVLISFYHINRYFIAWPLNAQTRSAFTTIRVLK